MLDVCLLGTAGMMPLPNRWLTSALFRYNGSSLLIDCGEGTQIALKEAGFSANPIDTILFTHYHADHISGLPGMLLTMGNADRTEPLLLVGPPGLQKTVEALRVIAPELPFQIEYKELSEPSEDFEIRGYHINAFKVNHNVPCYGYALSIKRGGKFDPEAAKSKGIPLKAWNPLQRGNEVTIDGVTYTPDMVIGPERKGLKVTYCTDSRPTKSMVEAAANSDLAILEGMYAEPDKIKKAKQYKHMTFYEAASVAKEASVKELWLTHFSPSLVGEKAYMKDVKAIFENVHLGRDGKVLELNFEED